jgi:ribosome biogenesis protein BRX1
MAKRVQTMPTVDDHHDDDDDDNVDEDDNMNYENDDDDEEENDEETASTRPNQTPPVIVSDGRYHNKQRCLTLCSRGVTARYRHLLEDLRTLIPHNKKESKLDCNDGSFGAAITNICDIRNCNTVLYMECRKRGQDAYLYMGYPQTGPSVKFHITNIHTMDELKLTGNCMKYSRPILSFDTNFNSLPQLQLLKNIFIDIFGIPRGHPKSKPFVDRVMAFYYGDNRVRDLFVLFFNGRRDCVSVCVHVRECVYDYKMMSVCRTFVLHKGMRIKQSFQDYDGMRQKTCKCVLFFCFGVAGRRY